MIERMQDKYRNETGEILGNAIFDELLKRC